MIRYDPFPHLQKEVNYMQTWSRRALYGMVRTKWLKRSSLKSFRVSILSNGKDTWFSLMIRVRFPVRGPCLIGQCPTQAFQHNLLVRHGSIAFRHACAFVCQVSPAVIPCMVPTRWWTKREERFISSIKRTAVPSILLISECKVISFFRPVVLSISGQLQSLNTPILSV